LRNLRIQAAALILLTLAAISCPIASAIGDFTLQVSPEVANVLRGGSIDYRLEVTSIDDFQGTLSIQVTGLPSQSDYSINPPPPVSLNPGETVNLTIAVATNVNTPIGSYSLNITATVMNLIHSKIVTLNVLSEALYITVSTDRKSYNPGENATISGRVAAPYIGVEEAEVSIELIAPDLTHIESIKTYTDREGYYQQNLTIKSDAPQGTYIVLVEASKAGFKETRAYAIIKVGLKKPSITITSIYSTDMKGEPQTIFKLGTTAVIWIEVQNTGGDLTNSLVWVQIEDPDGVTVAVMFQVATIRQGETFKAGFSLTLSSNQTLGQYTAKAFVSDKLIAQGGRFLTPPKQTTFTVTT